LSISFVAARLGIALGQQFVQGVPAPLTGLHDETASVNRNADLGASLQAQGVEQRRRDSQHDRAADFAQIGSVYGLLL
jgi:hypothetical protein